MLMTWKYIEIYFSEKKILILAFPSQKILAIALNQVKNFN